MREKQMKCVLIVDDDRVSNYVTENVLRSMEITAMINTVSDGQAGLEYLNYQCEGNQDYACPDLIILDINMRLVDGIEFVKRYRKLKIPQTSVIVILSTIALTEEQKKELTELGVTDFFIKPLTSEQLSGIIEEYFSSLNH